jgi:hypothetical protein
MSTTACALLLATFLGSGGDARAACFDELVCIERIGEALRAHASLVSDVQPPRFDVQLVHPSPERTSRTPNMRLAAEFRDRERNVLIADVSYGMSAAFGAAGTVVVGAILFPTNP